jgi:hypothetical protein
MTTEIHAHNVLNLLSEKPLTREELTQELLKLMAQKLVSIPVS